MMPLSLFRSARFSAANLITLLLYFALSGMLFLVPFNLIQLQGYSALETGMALLPFGLVMGLFSGLAGRLIDKVGPRPPLVIGPLIVAAACAGLGWTGLAGGYWAGVFGPILLLAIGLTVAVAPLTTAVMNAVPERDAGIASGINNAVSRLAGLIAVAVVGALATAFFARGLQAGLSDLALAPAVAAEMLAGTNDLAGLAVPADLAPDTAAAVKALIGASFLDGFRASMAVSATCAGLAALTAFLYLRTEPTENEVH
jgi:MFS family permease